MKLLIVSALALTTTAQAHAKTLEQRYPGCDLRTQHAVAGPLGGAITDPRQAHISIRANVLEADLSTARKARRLTQDETDQLYARIETVKTEADRYTRQQGFLSTGEAASYDRELDAVAAEACHPSPQSSAATSG